MKNRLLICFLLIAGHSLIAQTEILTFLEEDARSRTLDGYSFSNELTGDLALLLVENRNVHAHLFDATFGRKATFKSEPMPNKYSEIIGYQVSGDTYTVVATNKSQKKYAVHKINFSTKEATIDELKFDFGKETFLQAIQYQNELILITATKDNSFVLRKLNGSNEFTPFKTFNIEAEEKYQKLLRSGFFTVGLFAGPQVNITKVDNRVPNAIEQTAKSNKLYQKGNSLYLTLENDDALKTTLHIINLESRTLQTEVYEYPKGKKDDLKVYNSFILNDHIIQLGSSRDEMVLQIKSFDGNLLKEHYIDRDTPISIKNSAIIQEGRTALPFVNRREMEETSKFLRKVTSGNIGITAYEKDGLIYATIGGYKLVQNSSPIMMGGPAFGGTGGPVALPSGTYVPMYNPTYYSWNTYSSTKSTFFNTHFDASFNYVNREEQANIFERIKEFKQDVKYDTAEDVFFHQDILYFGYFDGKAKQYHLYKM
jgi:hypothetical protein